MAQHAIYRKLQPNQVRFMRMRHEDPSRPQCELGIFSMNDKPEYSALSYCWTSQEASCSIHLNNTPFMMRPNLYEYLKMMGEEKQDGWIFIDALCINQSDLDERSQQVRLMGRVYEDAVEVTAWMGVNAAVPSTELDRERGDDRAFLAEMQEICGNEATLLGVFPNVGDEDIKGMLRNAIDSAFTASHSWTRIWIAQEVILARSMTLRFGRLNLSLDLYYKYIMRYFRFLGLDWEWDTPQLGSLETSVMFGMMSHAQIWEPSRVRMENGLTPEIIAAQLLTVAQVLILRKQRKDRMRYSLPMELVTVITACSLRSCTDIRDKVFGILGLTQCSVRVDYSISRLELYLRVLIEGLMEYAAARLLENNVQRLNKVPLYDGVLFCAVLAYALDIDLRDRVVKIITSAAISVWSPKCGIERDTIMQEIEVRRLDTHEQVPFGTRPMHTASRTPGRIEEIRKSVQTAQTRLLSWMSTRLTGPDNGLGPKTVQGWKEYAESIVNEDIYSHQSMLRRTIGRLVAQLELLMQKLHYADTEPATEIKLMSLINRHIDNGRSHFDNLSHSITELEECARGLIEVIEQVHEFDFDLERTRSGGSTK